MQAGPDSSPGPEDRAAALGLSWAAGKGCRSPQRLLGDHRLLELWRAPVRTLVRWGLSEAAAKRFAGLRPGFNAAALEATMNEAGIRFIGYSHPEYPRELRHLADPPAGLYVRGTDSGWSRFLHAPRITVVGTRAATPGGLAAVEALCSALADAGIAVVSGLALGIDGRAHEVALECGAPTLAVLGSGADVPSPRAHTSLYERIRQRGAVASELLPGQRPTRWTFPLRNRLLAALGDAVLIVEAGARSGALVTVSAALELGRTVFVAPGPVCGGSYAGSLRLLYEGAVPAIEGRRLVEDFLSLTRNERGNRAAGRSVQEDGVPSDPEPGYAAPGEAGELGSAVRLAQIALGQGPVSLDEIAARAGISSSEAAAAVTVLELRGAAVRTGPGTYAGPAR